MAFLMLIAISLIIFYLMWLMPGDALTAFYDEDSRNLLGLNRSFGQSYLSWLTALLSGNFGFSYLYHQPISAIIGPFLRLSLVLQSLPFFLAFLLAIFLAAYQGYNLNKPQQKVLSLLMLLIAGIPVMILALALQYLFVFRWPLFPLYSVAAAFNQSIWPSLILPAFIIFIRYLSLFSRYLKEHYITVFRQPYSEMVHFKGGGTTAIFIHSLAPLSAAFIQLFMLNLPSLLSGSLVLETIFGLPGLGRLFYEAVIGRDSALVLFLAAIFAGVLLLASIIGDLLAALIDKRIAY